MHFTEDDFLMQICSEHIPVTVFLIGGIKLQGIISSFDRHTLFLRRDGHTQMIYKSAVSTVMPAAAVSPLGDVELI